MPAGRRIASQRRKDKPSTVIRDEKRAGAGLQIAAQNSGTTSSLVSRPGSIAQRSATVRTKTERMLLLEESMYRHIASGSPRVDHLLTLIKLNAFRALFSNNAALGFAMEWLAEDAVSPFNATQPQRLVDSCPPSLRPTALQCMVHHHPWIDLIPIPTMRDNLLLAGDFFDDTQLCMDVVEFWSSPGERTGLIVHGDPWEPQHWEVSEEFLRKWAWVIKGCWGLFQSTNYFRTKRGERKLFTDALLSTPALPYPAFSTRSC